MTKQELNKFYFTFLGLTLMISGILCQLFYWDHATSIVFFVAGIISLLIGVFVLLTHAHQEYLDRQQDLWKIESDFIIALAGTMGHNKTTPSNKKIKPDQAESE